MDFSTPAAGEGISVSTLSVETSSNGSSASTRSPSFFNQRVTVPSETLSPRRGIVTETDMTSFPDGPDGRVSRGRAEAYPRERGVPPRQLRKASGADG